jgi:hypothetical protein
MYIPQVERGLSAQPPPQHKQTLSSLLNDSSLIPVLTSLVHIIIIITSDIILNIMRTIYVLNKNKRKKTLEKLDNRDILLGQPTLITGRGIKSSVIFVQSTQKQQEARNERRNKKKCCQCLETRNFNLHTADENVAVPGWELRSAVVINTTFIM